MNLRKTGFAGSRWNWPRIVSNVLARLKLASSAAIATVVGANLRVLPTSLYGGQKDNAYTVSTKDITDIVTETANYKVLPLGNKVCSMDSICFLTCYPSQPSDPLAITSNGSRGQRFAPSTVVNSEIDINED
jgi:hypothetical protein